MKHLSNLFAVLGAALALAALPAAGASWNDQTGMGNALDEFQFGGVGTPLSVVQSVHSNAQYFITSANGQGGARYERILVKPDLTGCNLDFYVATNVWTCASNQPAGTNIIWLTTTNSMMATNDILVLRGSGDVNQLLIVSGNATDATGLVFTNSAGYVGIKVFNTPTNVITAGDTLYKMARQLRLNPLSDNNVTNKLVSPWGNWLNVNDIAGGQPLYLRGKIGQPTALVLTVSNAGSLYVSGEYFVRQRR